MTMKKILVIPLVVLGFIVMPFACMYAHYIGIILLPGGLQIRYWSLVSRMNEGGGMTMQDLVGLVILVVWLGAVLYAIWQIGKREEEDI